MNEPIVWLGAAGAIIALYRLAVWYCERQPIKEE